MLPDDDIRQQTLKRIVDELNWTSRVFAISAISNEGTQQLCYALMQLIDDMKTEENDID